MKYYDERLQALQEQITRKKHLDAKLADLKKQQAEIKQYTAKLMLKKIDEERDVSKLEGKSLSAFFYAVIGQKSERLAKERLEAYEARVKYETSADELNAINTEISATEQELKALDGCMEQYEQVLKEKADAIKANDSQLALEILQAEERISFFKGYQKEINEAIFAGKLARETARDIIESLYHTQQLWQTQSPNRRITANLQARDQIDAAQSSIGTLQIRLRKFKSELADVSEYLSTNVSPDRLTGFANNFYSGFFDSWLSIGSIENSQEQINDAITQIDTALYKLSSISKNIEKQLLETKRKLEKTTIEYS